MKGNFIDNINFSWKSIPNFERDFFFLDTDFGRIRAFDTNRKKLL